MADIKLLNPDTLGKPLGPYSHIARVKASEFLFIAGQVGAGNGRQGRRHVRRAVRPHLCGARRRAEVAGRELRATSVEFTTYMVHSQDIPKFMAWRAANFPKLFPSGAYPPNTLLIIDRLVKEELLIEISAVAAL